jgi:non-heme chloroperoxidase
MSSSTITNGSVKTWDDVTLRYIQAGPAPGSTLLLIPGWAQTAAQWRKQIDYFSSHKYNVIAYDHRGQGESDKPSHGYRIARLAADLNDLILQLDLKDVTIMGHSMGCSVIWAYWGLFASSRNRIKNLILVDQSACMIPDPSWSPEKAASISVFLKPGMAFELANALRGPEALQAVTGLVGSMFTSTISEEDLKWTLQQNSKMSYDNAATLLIEHSYNDWRDVLPTIDVPTLVIGAEQSLMSVETMPLIANQIPGAKVRVFGKEEKGSHFIFWENPDLFNKVVEDFLNGVSK